MATLFKGGVVGGLGEIDITEAVEEIRLETTWEPFKFGRIRTREIRERQLFAGEIGCTISNMIEASANPVIVESASWDVSEETVIHYQSVSSDIFTADEVKPFVNASRVTVRYKHTEGRFTLLHDNITDPDDVDVDFRINASEPYIKTASAHVITSELSTGKITVTLPIGARIRQLSQKEVLDNLIKTDYEFSFKTKHGSTPPADSTAHLIDILTPDPDYGFVGDTVAYFGNSGLGDAGSPQYTVTQSFSLSGSGTEEGSGEQTITVYDDAGAYYA